MKPRQLLLSYPSTFRTSSRLGDLVVDVRRAHGLTQAELAAVAGTGARFIFDLEWGKPTLEIQKTLDVLDALGLEVRIGPKRPTLG